MTSGTTRTGRVIRRLLIIPPILIAAVVLVLVMKNKKAPEQVPAVEQSRTVRTLTIKPLDVVPRILGFGVVQPGRVWNAVAQVSGPIVRVHPDFKKGALLKKGTEIVRISPDDYEIAITQAKANIRAAEAKLQELRVNRDNIQATLTLERQSLAINEKEYERSLALKKRGTIAQASLDKERRNLLNQRKKVLDYESVLKLIPSQIKAQIEQKTISASQLKTAQLNLKRTRIILPFDARIAKVNVEVTQFVGAGTVLGVADSISRAEIPAQIPIKQFRSLLKAATGSKKASPFDINQGSMTQMAKALGMHAIVRVHFDDQAVEWPGRVVRISDTVDLKTSTIGAIVVVDKAYQGAVPGERPPLIKGMFVEVEIRTTNLPGQIIIPRAALHGGKVYLVDDKSRLRLRPVEIKILQGDFAVISKGLAANDRVVVSDLSPAIEGMLLVASEDGPLGKRLAVQASGGGSLK